MSSKSLAEPALDVFSPPARPQPTRCGSPRSQIGRPIGSRLSRGYDRATLNLVLSETDSGAVQPGKPSARPGLPESRLTAFTTIVDMQMAPLNGPVSATITSRSTNTSASRIMRVRFGRD
jgi:hypothetical protein